MKKYTVDKLKRDKNRKGKCWIVVFKDEDRYEVYGTFEDVIKLCDEVCEAPIYVSTVYDYPVLVTKE